MKDIKEFLVKESKLNNIKLNDIKYVMVSYYENRSNIEPAGYLFKDISDIKDQYWEWELEEDEIKPIIDKVQKLKVNECWTHMQDEQSFEVISRIK